MKLNYVVKAYEKKYFLHCITYIPFYLQIPKQKMNVIKF